MRGINRRKWRYLEESTIDWKKRLMVEIIAIPVTLIVLPWSIESLPLQFALNSEPLCGKIQNSQNSKYRSLWLLIDPQWVRIRITDLEVKWLNICLKGLVLQRPMLALHHIFFSGLEDLLFVLLTLSCWSHRGFLIADSWDCPHWKTRP